MVLDVDLRTVTILAIIRVRLLDFLYRFSMSIRVSMVDLAIQWILQSIMSCPQLVVTSIGIASAKSNYSTTRDVFGELQRGEPLGERIILSLYGISFGQCILGVYSMTRDTRSIESNKKETAENDIGNIAK